VTATAREHEMLEPGDVVLVACSGGPDSVCLLYALHHLRRLLKIHRLEVFHFDHRLRDDSARDSAYVRAMAERLHHPFHVRIADTAPARGGSVESWARTARRNASLEVAAEIGATRIATAHTMDDQAETVLMRALMGSGLSGVAGIKPVLGWWIRPLIGVRREEVEEFCRALHLRPRIDPTNRDPRFLRNSIRHKALPALERATGRDVVAPLARTADLLREDDRELLRQMQAAFGRVFRRTPEGATLQVERLLALPSPVAERVIAQALFRLAQPATRQDIRAVLDLARGTPGRRRDLTVGSTAVREREYVRVSRPSPRPA
jgi:tRNA(Ile)-lysidine synthase